MAELESGDLFLRQLAVIVSVLHSRPALSHLATAFGLVAAAGLPC